MRLTTEQEWSWPSVAAPGSVDVPGVPEGANEIYRGGRIGASNLAAFRVEHEQWLSSKGEEGRDGRAVLSAAGLSGADRGIGLVG